MRLESLVWRRAGSSEGLELASCFPGLLSRCVHREYLLALEPGNSDELGEGRSEKIFVNHGAWGPK